MTAPISGRVSGLGLGGATLGNHLREVSETEARAVLDRAWSAGIRHFDTAPHYGLGLSERRLGDFLADKPRAEFTLSTKVGRLLVPVDNVDGRLDDEGFVVPGDLRRVWDFSEDGVRRSLQGSLTRLGLDAVDTVYLHDPERWDLDRALDLGLPALRRLRAEGLTTSVGVGSMAWESLAAAVRRGTIDDVMLAGRWTLADHSAGAVLLPLCHERGVGVTAAAVFNGGLLAARPGDAATFDYRQASSEVLALTRSLAEVCASYDVPLATAALQWPLRHPAVRRVVIGADSPAQVAANAAAFSAAVPDELWSALAQRELVPA